MLKKAIIEIAKEEGMSDEEIAVFEADCWQHLRNIWFKAVYGHLCQYLTEYLADNLDKISKLLLVYMDIMLLLIATEKYFGKICNYAKVRKCFL